LDEMACGSAMRAGENAMGACSSKMPQAFMLVVDGVPDPCASSTMAPHPSGPSLPRFGAGGQLPLGKLEKTVHLTDLRPEFECQ
jgi:hypothetical protein